jgi:hypothetical protein
MNIDEGGSDDKSASVPQEASAAASSAIALLAATSTLMNPNSSINIDSLSSSIGPNDVLLGRGGGTNHHIGNLRFRELVKDYQPLYLQAKKLDKANVAKQIVSIVVNRGGRFLMQRDDGVWEEVTSQRAREKTSQALRENLIVRSAQLRPSKDKKHQQQIADTQQPNAIGIHHPTPPSSPTLLEHQQIQSKVATVLSPSSLSSSSVYSAPSNVKENVQLQVPMTSVTTSTSSPTSDPRQEQQQQDQRKRRVYTIKKSFVTGTVVNPSNSNTDPKLSSQQSAVSSQQANRKQKRLQNKQQKKEMKPTLPTSTTPAAVWQSGKNTTQTSPSIVSVSSSSIGPYNHLRSIENNTLNKNKSISYYNQGVVPSSTCSSQLINQDNNRLMIHDDMEDIDTALVMVHMATNRI